jgi:hypothetical protein
MKATVHFENWCTVPDRAMLELADRALAAQD